MSSSEFAEDSSAGGAAVDELRRRRVEDLFHEVAVLPPDKRENYLDAQRDDDPAVRSEVERLLKHFGSSRISSLREADRLDEVDSELAGTRIGPYKLLELIGEGGFGAVYMAEQETPIRRRVALKIIKPGMDTKQVIARFEAERQALALMDHPNIAKVFDAGATDAGRPYFAMELVRGIPLTEHCDEHRLPVRERLLLFIQVCRAVQHAHHRGVIHRDIKPSNVLVTLHDGTPIPKIIDFGIAKATCEPLTDKTLFTAFRQFIGTPEYMSPEQAEMSGLGVDTRSDIYSLGVLLYELLTGTTPFDSKTLRGAAYGELQRMIREQDPPIPSRRVSSLGENLQNVARSRRVEPRLLNKLMRGDLDWIVMKAIEKDRNRRYESAGELAADVERNLNQEPVSAGPPSPGYRLRKLVLRHKTLFGFLAMLFTLVTSFSIWMSFLYADADRLRLQAEQARGVAEEHLIRARAAEAAATEEAETAKETVEFLVGLFEVADPVSGQSDSVTAREILEQGAARVREELKNRPATQATLMHAMGRVYHNLGLYDRAIDLLTEAVDARQKTLGREHPDTLAAMNSLGWALCVDERFTEAEAVQREAMDIGRSVLGIEHSETLTSITGLAWTLQSVGKLEEAEALSREALAGRRRTLGDDHAKTLSSLNSLSWLLQRRGKFDEAEELCREALETNRRIHGDQHVYTADSMSVLGTLLMKQRKLSEAEPLLAEAETIRRGILGEDHPSTIEAASATAWLLWRQGKLAEAEVRFNQTLASSRRAFGEKNRRALLCMQQLAGVLVDRGKEIEAAKMLSDAYAGLHEVLGPAAPDTIQCLINWSEVLFLCGDVTEAEPALRETLATLRRTLGHGHELSLRVATLSAIAIEQQGNVTEAEALYRDALATALQTLPEDHPRVSVIKNCLGACLSAQGRYAEAESLLLESTAAIRARRGDAHRLTRLALQHVVNLYEAWGKMEQANEWRAQIPPTPPLDVRQTSHD